LQQSVGQREQLQKMLLTLPKPPEPCSAPTNLFKVRTAINKTYTGLISKGTFSREAILNHKREVNGILDELLAV
jgi:hypothetical protein